MSEVYQIPVAWESYGIVKVVADSPEDALKKFNEHISNFHLPKNAEYVEDSFEAWCEDEEQQLERIVPDKGDVDEEVYDFEDKEIDR